MLAASRLIWILDMVIQDEKRRWTAYYFVEVDCMRITKILFS